MSTDRTPIDRAKEALSPSESRATKRTEYGEMSTPILLLSAENAARAAVSAALTNDADPDWIAKALASAENEHFELCGDTHSVYGHLAAAVRAKILGADQ